jgi:hypothetical protein
MSNTKEETVELIVLPTAVTTNSFKDCSIKLLEALKNVLIKANGPEHALILGQVQLVIETFFKVNVDKTNELFAPPLSEEIINEAKRAEDALRSLYSKKLKLFPKLLPFNDEEVISHGCFSEVVKRHFKFSVRIKHSTAEIVSITWMNKNE